MSSFDSLFAAFDWKSAFGAQLDPALAAGVQENYLSLKTEALLQPAFEQLCDIRFEAFPFHNQNHCMSVLWGVLLLSSAEKLQETDRQRLLAAAAYHDLGYLEGAAGHEGRSAEVFLHAAEGDAELFACLSPVESVQDLILSTELQADETTGLRVQKPRGELSKFLLDADLLNIGFEFSAYCRICSCLFEEQEGLPANEASEDRMLSFQDHNLRFLERHEFQTTVAQQLFSAAKTEKIERLKQANKSKEVCFL